MTPLLPCRPAILSPDLELALHGDEDLDQLDDARRQLVALLQELDPLLVDPMQDLDVGVGLAVDDLDLRRGALAVLDRRA